MTLLTELTTQVLVFSGKLANSTRLAPLFSRMMADTSLAQRRTALEPCERLARNLCRWEKLSRVESRAGAGQRCSGEFNEGAYSQLA